MPFAIEPIPCLSDNYCYLIRSGSDAYLVDPSEAGPPQRALREQGLKLRGILLTHHHWDHVGGVGELQQAAGGEVWVAAHESDRGRIEHQSHFIVAPERSFVDTGLFVGDAQLRAMHIPGHTSGAIAWLLPDSPSSHCFTGDTLFAAGCGRLFEGTPSDMFSSLHAICSLDATTRLWFGHEYTAANLRFAQTVEPDNAAVTERLSALSACTTPTTVAHERATNPFLRAADADALGERRRAKDAFRG